MASSQTPDKCPSCGYAPGAPGGGSPEEAGYSARESLAEEHADPAAGRTDTEEALRQARERGASTAGTPNGGSHWQIKAVAGPDGNTASKRVCCPACGAVVSHRQGSQDKSGTAPADRVDVDLDAVGLGNSDEASSANDS
jgi:hypothetical protein